MGHFTLYYEISYIPSTLTMSNIDCTFGNSVDQDQFSQDLHVLLQIQSVSKWTGWKPETVIVL